jgi:hypothetical protein
MSTPSEREAALRRALLSAAEQIEPAPGGLEAIHVRLKRPHPALVAWVEAAWTALVMRAPDVTEAIRRQTANVLRLVWERFGPRSAPGPGPHRLSWVRPLSAMAVAVFVLGAGVYVALQSVSSPISPAGGLSTGTSVGSGSHTPGRGSSGSGATDGHGTQSPGSPAPSSSRRSQTCSPSHSASVFKTGQASTAPAINPPTPTPSSTSPSPSPSPSSSVSTSSTPASSTPPPSVGAASTPDAGDLASAASANATLSAALSSPAPCQTTKSHKHSNHSATLTSAQLTGTRPAQAQPASTVAAKL